MTKRHAKRHAEIVGAGFAGLTAACALARRGWSVRVHERADRLRTTGAGIYIYENGLRVLEAVGAYEAAVKGAPFAHTREVRDDRNRTISVHRWQGTSRVYSIVRQTVINALAEQARLAGAEIALNSEGVSVTPDGVLTMSDGRTLKADLVIGADGTNSRLRDSLGLLDKRKYLVDGCTRLLIDKTPDERGQEGATTIEYWSGSRRVLYTPCSETEVYIALTMLDSDEEAKVTPVRRDVWKRWFPHLEALIDRLGDGRYDRFEYSRLKRWSAGRVAVIGDAAHALPPNIGQGGGCAMMNALAMSVYLDRESDVPSALAAWEKNERAITEHTQRISLMLGWPTTWPPAIRAKTLQLAGKWKWLVRQRTKTALHVPTGT
jgi:2-polyprenyl-6-methoxyphenol hydroxylase-like FAD-dependent oxidoreductase